MKKAGEPGSMETPDGCVCGHATFMQAVLMYGHTYRECFLVCFLLYFLIKIFNHRFHICICKFFVNKTRPLIIYRI
jgi:hypothetical protein